MSQEELGREAGLTLGAYARIELAKTAPSWDSVKNIAAALGMTMAQFCAEIDKE